MLSYSNIPILFSLKGFDENYMWILFIIKHWTFDRTSYQNNLTDLFSSVGYLYYLASELTYTLVSVPPPLLLTMFTCCYITGRAVIFLICWPKNVDGNISMRKWLYWVWHSWRTKIMCILMLESFDTEEICQGVLLFEIRGKISFRENSNEVLD